jgi:hypothetical protein
MLRRKPKSQPKNPDAGLKRWLLDHDTSPKRLYKEAQKAAHGFTAPSEPVDAPPCFHRAASLTVEYGSALIELHDADHAEEILSIAANHDIEERVANLRFDETLKGLPLEQQLRHRHELDIRLRKVRRDRASLATGEMRLGNRLTGMEQAGNRLLAAMQTKFLSRWNYLESADLIVWPVIDLQKLRTDRYGYYSTQLSAAPVATIDHLATHARKELGQ